jgi:hypothetical protein
MRLSAFIVLIGLAFDVGAQDLQVYDDALQNGFVDNYSYGGGTDLQHAVTTHNASAFAIAFTGNNSNAVAFPHETVDFTTSQYAGVRFYVHGGATGGQQLRFQVYNNLGGVPLANVELDSFISGAAIAANEWRLVEVRFADAPLAFSGNFDRFDLQSDDPDTQPVLYIDDVSLIDATPPSPDIFSNGFENGGSPGPVGELRFTSATFGVGEAAGNATISVERVNGSFGAVSVEYASSDGTATQPDDYAASTGTLSWSSGASGVRTFTVAIANDAVDEPDETIGLALSAATGGASIVAPATAVLSIADDDAAPVPGELRFSAASYSVGETDGTVTVSVQRINGSDGVVSVDYATADATAVAPGDYSSTAGTLVWADGDVLDKTFDIPIVNDGIAENDEMLALALSNAAGAALGNPSAATVAIVEPEYLFVPQYTTNRIKVYRREAAGFTLVNTAVLAAGTQPNALAFAPDGHLWVVDSGATKRLLRYSAQSVIAQANPVAEVSIGPVGAGSGDIFDMAFFGDFAYVSQSNFGGTHRIVKYTTANLGVSGNPASTLLTAASLNVPAGLEFDALGRLWISNYGNNSVVRMNTGSGVVDRIGSNTAIGARNALNLPEGLAFDADDTLWVGNNGEPTISGYAQWQLDDAGFGATPPVHQIDVNPALFQGDTVGGLAFDRDGDLWANYQKTFSVLEYTLAPGPRPGGLPGVGSYASAAGQVLGTATTFPGFGGIALWPIPASTHLTSASFRGTNVVGMEMGYTFFPQATGPVGDTHYPVHDTRLIDYFASKGMTTIRFLFSWEGMQSSLMGPIPAAPAGNYKLYFDRYKNIVDYATNAKGMQVIIEPWQADPGGGAGGPRWRGGLVGSGAVPTAAWIDFWGKLAAVYADNPRVSFGLVNEPNNMSTMGWWAIAQAGITAIRNAGATQRI